MLDDENQQRKSGMKNYAHVLNKQLNENAVTRLDRHKMTNNEKRMNIDNLHVYFFN